MPWHACHRDLPTQATVASRVSCASQSSASVESLVVEKPQSRSIATKGNAIGVESPGESNGRLARHPGESTGASLRSDKHTRWVGRCVEGGAATTGRDARCVPYSAK